MKHISDEKLFELCRQYGKQALMWRRKFLGLLPEVYRRKLYEKKGFSSIFEFAKKLAGVSEEQIRLVLNLDKKFEDKPILKAMFESGEVSINKLVRIASVVTPENQDYWATQIRVLPQSALETLVRDERTAVSVNMTEDQNGLYKPIFGEKSLRAQSIPQQNPNELNLSNEVKQRLLELQNKGIDINQLILEFIEKREQGIALEKEQIAQEIVSVKQPRYIPIKIRRIIQKEYGRKCSIPTCSKQSEEIHHTQRFSLAKNHNPYFLAPLCRGHHLIAHSIDQKFQHERSAHGTTPSALPLLSPAL